MARDPKLMALHKLHVAKSDYEVACKAKIATRELLNAAMLKAYEAGVSKAEISRSAETSAQRVGQIIAELVEAS